MSLSFSVYVGPYIKLVDPSTNFDAYDYTDLPAVNQKLFHHNSDDDKTIYFLPNVDFLSREVFFSRDADVINSDVPLMQNYALEIATFMDRFAEAINALGELVSGAVILWGVVVRYD